MKKRLTATRGQKEKVLFWEVGKRRTYWDKEKPEKWLLEWKEKDATCQDRKETREKKSNRRERIYLIERSEKRVDKRRTIETKRAMRNKDETHWDKRTKGQVHFWEQRSVEKEDREEPEKGKMSLDWARVENENNGKTHQQKRRRKGEKSSWKRTKERKEYSLDKEEWEQKEGRDREMIKSCQKDCHEKKKEEERSGTGKREERKKWLLGQRG